MHGWVMCPRWIPVDSSFVILYIDKSRHTHKQVISHVWMNHVTCMDESCVPDEYPLTLFLWYLWPFFRNIYACVYRLTSYIYIYMGWLRLVGSLKWKVSFAEYRLFYRALLQKRPTILRSLLNHPHIAIELLYSDNDRSLFQNILSFIGLFCERALLF